VLVLFVVMLTLRRRQDAVRSLDASPVAAVLAIAFVIAVSIGITRFSPAAAQASVKTPDIARFGAMLFDVSGPIMLPFEIASVVNYVADQFQSSLAVWAWSDSQLAPEPFPGAIWNTSRSRSLLCAIMSST
jgi:xanthine/uracil permease